MKRHELILALAGFSLLVWGAAWIRAGRGPTRDAIIDGGPACPAAPILILEPVGALRGTVVILHGLSANRIVMLTNGQQIAAAGFRVFLPDGPGHGNNTAPFSFAAYEACARGLLSTFELGGQISPQRTVLLGHSLGAAIAIRLADDFPAAATIAVASAPLVSPHRMPANLLLVAPQFDMPAVLATESRLAAAAGAVRAAPEDFRQLRAFRLLSVPAKSHTSALFDPIAARTMLRWALDSVGPADVPVPALDYRAFAGGWLGLLGIVLVFPATTSVFTRLYHVRPISPAPRACGAGVYLMAWIGALVPAAIVAARWNFMASLRIFGADYLASIFLLAGIPLCVAFAVLVPRNASSRGSVSRPPLGCSLASVTCAVTVGLVTIVTTGAWLNLQLTEAWPILARWERFPRLLIPLLPMCLAEELALGDPRIPGILARVGRFGLFAALRTIVWLVILGAWLSGVSGALLGTIFLLFLAALSLAQRFGADALRSRTGSALAAAIFNAILGAWFLAAAFPLA